jgi:hypothetical protein
MRFKGEPLPPPAPAAMDVRAQFGLDHLFSMTAAALMPLAQSAITGGMIGLGVMGLFWLAEVHNPWKAGLAAAIIFTIGFWGIAMARWFSLTKLETWLGMDLNRDGFTGEPPVVKVEITERHDKQSSSTKFVELPATEEQLKALAQGLMRGAAMSERQWAGTHKPFSSTEFRALRAVMIKRALIEAASEKDNRTGFVLTEAGRAVMEELAACR